MKVLVAGGAGFIGSHFCETLLDQGFEVFCLDNFLTGHKRNIAGFLGQKKFHLVEFDLIRSLPQRLTKQKFEFIFHLASPASPNPQSPLSYLHYPIETLLVNSLGNYNLLNLVKKCKAKFLYASTSEVYGDSQLTPQKENYWGNVNPHGIRSCYDEGKRFGEAMTMAFVRKFNVDARIVRIFNTFGPRMDKNDGRVVVNFINQALKGKPLTVYGDGSQTRSFCYIDDLIEGFMLAILKPKTKGEVINLGNPEEHTILDLAKIILKLTKSKSKIVFQPLPVDDPKQRCPDITKAKSILHWQPKVALEEALFKTIDYFRKDEGC